MSDELKWFKKKPVVVMAMQISQDTDPNKDEVDANSLSLSKVMGWIMGNGGKASIAGDRAPFGLAITTMEGIMLASPGDYVIRGVQGEFYPCREDIFLQTYEEVVDG